jgi:type IV secretion system protein VirB9
VQTVDPPAPVTVVVELPRRRRCLANCSVEETRRAPEPSNPTARVNQANEAARAQPVASGVDLANVNFRYAIEGDRAPWRPLRAFDDGRQVFIEFPRGIGQGEMPPLFVVGPEGNTSELVNYRVRGHHMIVDRLFAAAELRFGSGREQKRVRIVRTDGRPTS